jgi:hypothetical protein
MKNLIFENGVNIGWLQNMKQTKEDCASNNLCNQFFLAVQSQ